MPADWSARPGCWTWNATPQADQPGWPGGLTQGNHRIRRDSPEMLRLLAEQHPFVGRQLQLSILHRHQGSERTASGQSDGWPGQERPGHLPMQTLHIASERRAQVSLRVGPSVGPTDVDVAAETLRLKLDIAAVSPVFELLARAASAADFAAEITADAAREGVGA